MKNVKIEWKCHENVTDQFCRRNPGYDKVNKNNRLKIFFVKNESYYGKLQSLLPINFSPNCCIFIDRHSFMRPVWSTEISLNSQ